MREHVRIVIRFPTVILFLLLILFEGNPDALMPLAAALCHEAGHLCAMRLFGVNVREIEITMFGAEIRSLPSAQSTLRQIIIFGAGAAVNFFCAGILLFLHSTPMLDFFTVCSILMGFPMSS